MEALVWGYVPTWVVEARVGGREQTGLEKQIRTRMCRGPWVLIFGN
ncbi:MAG: hypothetical protein V1775_06845 [Bacteroidota bacterium]